MTYLRPNNASGVNVFISHQRNDKRIALQVQEKLSEQGIASFLDATANGPSGYQSITDWIVDNLRKSTHMLVIYSSNTRSSAWVPFEIGVGYERNEGIGVLLLTNNFDLPEYIKELPKMRDLESLKYFVLQCNNYPGILATESPALGSINGLPMNYARNFINELNARLR